MFSKQLLYLTNDQLTAYQWERGSLSSGHAFPNDEAGWEAFSHHLAGAQNIPIYILADLIEEDFQRDTLPHVLGTAKRKLIQRRLGQLYRDTPYRQAIAQGRETEGRKDARMLFSALTNAELLKPWLDALLKQKAPLASIYSPALLSGGLIKKLDLSRDHLLLVTQQSSGLRQSYFQGPFLKFSRLTPLVDHSPAAVAEAVVAETAKTHQFLTSTRLLPRDVAMDVVILSHGEGLRQLQAECRDTPAMAHTVLDLKDAAHSLGLKNLASFSSCNPLFLSLLGQSHPASHYALPEQTRFFMLWQARIALYSLSFAALAGGLAWAGSNSLDALNYRLQSRQMALETRSAQAQYQTIVRSLPPTAASPQSMKAAVDIEQMIARNAPTPAALLGIVSRSLDRLPQIRIDQLQWQASEAPPSPADPANPQQPGGQPPATGAAEPAPPAVLVGIPGKPYQTVLIEGEVMSFQHDYRTALESVRQFAAELGKNKQMQVEITRQPLDIRPAAQLEGKAGNEDVEAKASFSLKLVWKPGA